MFSSFLGVEEVDWVISNLSTIQTIVTVQEFYVAVEIMVVALSLEETSMESSFFVGQLEGEPDA